jgi:LPS-assembly lipoprotein
MTRGVSLALLVASICVAPLGCGFRPLYQADDRGGPARVLAQVAIDPVPDRVGQMLRNQLLDQFSSGVGAGAPYRLALAPLVEQINDLDITIDDEATRRSLRLSTRVQLIDTRNGAVVVDRPVYSLVSFNVLPSQFTTRVAEQNARENAVVDLARQIEQIVVLVMEER